MSIEGLDKYSAKGYHLLDDNDPMVAHQDFNQWIREVSNWLNESFPNSGLSADWAAQGDSNLVIGNEYYNDYTSWSLFRMNVQRRLHWFSRLPVKLNIARLSTPALAQNEAKEIGRKEIKLQTVSRAYVDPDRINELKSLSQQNYDLGKLVRLCEELNICFASECYLAMVMLTRAILDHIPPIFGCRSFAEVANHCSGKSFKENMQNLENSLRKISDHYLHSQIRSSESLPNVTQIDFSNNLDFLLAEITRIIR